MSLDCPTKSDVSTWVFYKGGQFLPGGGRSPAGGCLVWRGQPNPKSTSLEQPTWVFYKGGQFLPGGGRAPAGGCHVRRGQPNPRSTSSRPPTRVFDKGGQFPAGAEPSAPSGGCLLLQGNPKTRGGLRVDRSSQTEDGAGGLLDVESADEVDWIVVQDDIEADEVDWLVIQDDIEPVEWYSCEELEHDQ